MKKRWRSLVRAFWALDRALGGRRKPTRLQRWVARHPVGAGLCVAVPCTLFLWVTAPEGESDGFPVAVLLGLLMGSVVALVAAVERLRQRRLGRPGQGEGKGRHAR